MASTDQGITVKLEGERQTSPAYPTGNPTSAYGSYDTFAIGQANPNGMTNDSGVTVYIDGQRQSAPAYYAGSTIGTHGSYNVVSSVSSTVNTPTNEAGTTGITRTNIPTPLINNGSGGSGVTKYFKMVGYYVTGAVYESFVVTGSPTGSTAFNPNTGHTLTNTFVSSFWEI